MAHILDEIKNRADDEPTKEEIAKFRKWAKLELPRKDLIRFVRQVDTLVSAIRCANYSEKDVEKALRKVETMLQRNMILFGICFVGWPEWKDVKLDGE